MEKTKITIADLLKLEFEPEPEYQIHRDWDNDIKENMLVEVVNYSLTAILPIVISGNVLLDGRKIVNLLHDYVNGMEIKKGNLKEFSALSQEEKEIFFNIEFDLTKVPPMSKEALSGMFQMLNSGVSLTEKQQVEVKVSVDFMAYGQTKHYIQQENLTNLDEINRVAEMLYNMKFFDQIENHLKKVNIIIKIMMHFAYGSKYDLTEASVLNHLSDFVVTQDYKNKLTNTAAYLQEYEMKAKIKNDVNIIPVFYLAHVFGVKGAKSADYYDAVNSFFALPKQERFEYTTHSNAGSMRKEQTGTRIAILEKFISEHLSL